MKKLTVTSFICILLILLAGCSSNVIADKVINYNIDNLYLVVLGEGIAESVDIDNLPISINEFDQTYSSRKYKLILVTDTYVNNLTSEQVTMLKGLIIEQRYWVLYNCNDKTEVNFFAHKFGKSINLSEQNYIRGYKLLYNKTQSVLQGIPSYSTSNSFDTEELNNIIKQTYCDMIENRLDMI